MAQLTGLIPPILEAAGFNHSGERDVINNDPTAEITQIEQYFPDLSFDDDKISTLKDKDEDLENQIEDLEKEIDSLNEQIADLERV